MHFKIGPYYYVILRYSLLSWLMAKIRLFRVNKNMKKIFSDTEYSK